MQTKHESHQLAGEAANTQVSRRYQTLQRGAQQILTLVSRRQGRFLSKSRAVGSCSPRKQWLGVETRGSIETWLRLSTLSCLISAPVSWLAGKSALVMLLPIASAQACSAVTVTPGAAQGPFLGKSAMLIKHSAIVDRGCPYLWQLNEYLDDFLLN